MGAMYEWAEFCMSGQFPLGDINPYKYFYSIAVVVGLLFASVGPKDEHPLWLIIMQWQLQTLIPMTALIASHIVLSFSPRFNRLTQWQQILISGVMGSALFTPFAALVDIYMMGEGYPEHLANEIYDEFQAVVVPVTLTWLLLNAPWLLGVRYQKISYYNNPSKDDGPRETDEVLHPVDQKGSAQHSGGNLLSALQIDRYEQIQSMSSELHYISVVSDYGKELILYSLKSAIDELPHNLGMQVHRSHWIAYSHIKTVNKKGREGHIVTLNNLTVPVSRKYMPLLMEQMDKQK
jgi:hypothetical protein